MSHYHARYKSEEISPRDATASKKNGAANVRKIGRRYHKIFRSRCPGGICTNTEMTHEFLGGGGHARIRG